MNRFKVLILGGYGNFGKRIAENLAQQANFAVLIAGRDIQSAEALCNALHSSESLAQFQAVQIDVFSRDFTAYLKRLAPNLVIHTSGPFQGQDYSVPLACIDANCHYIDLADDRRFVCDIAQLDEKAKTRNLCIISGASSVPGLSSAVVEKHSGEFRRLEEIDFCIAPGNKAERGLATVKGILSYTGRPFKVLEHGEWQNRYGWMSPRKVTFVGPVGTRWLANVDIPDLELFPQRYQGVQTVRFQAGLELRFLHFVMVGMAFLAKLGIVRNWAPLAKPVFKTSELFASFGSDVGGMRIALRGLDHKGGDRRITWTLTANKGIGPYIPTISAVILAKKLAAGDPIQTGAMACVGLFSLDDFDKEVAGLDISHTIEIE